MDGEIIISIKQCISLASGMKTGLVLLIVIGASSALGSIIAPTTFYNLWGFQLLVFLLLLNMTLCAVRTLNGYIKQHYNRGAKRQYYPRKLGVLLIHLGIIGILLGATLNAYYGQSTQIAILKGNQLDTADVITSKTPFMLQLDDFRVEFNPDGSPAQYYSDVTVLENGYILAKGSISVNHPLQYKDIKFYQQDYGYVVKGKYPNDKGEEIEAQLAEGSILEIPGTKQVMKVLQYAPDFNPNRGLNQIAGRADNPRIIFSVSENNQLLEIGAARFNEKIDIDNNTAIYFIGVEPYTVLKVKSDPGLPLAFTGGLMFVCGLALTLLSRPVNVKPKGIMTG